MKNNSYNEFVKKMNMALNNRVNNEAEFTNALEEVAKYSVFSVLRRLDAVRGSAEKLEGKKQTIGNTERPAKYRRELMQDIKALDALKNGYADKVLKGLSDSMDLLQAANAEILGEMQKSKERGDSEFDLTRPYIIKKLKKRVYINDAAPEWIDKETMPIKQVFRAVRREIEKSRSVKPNMTGCSYIEEYATEDENADNIIYRRFGKYADVGGYINGKTYNTGSDAKHLYKIRAALELSPRQGEILKRREQGLPLVDIANDLQIDKRSVTKQLERIRKKACEINFVPRHFKKACKLQAFIFFRLWIFGGG